jgi:hypothetical protein
MIFFGNNFGSPNYIHPPTLGSARYGPLTLDPVHSW